MSTAMKFLFYRSTKKENQRGLAPIYCRITYQGQRDEFSTGISCLADEWDSDHHSVKGNMIASARLQDILQRLILILESYQNRGHELTSSQLVYLYKNEERDPRPPAAPAIRISALEAFDQYLVEYALENKDLAEATVKTLQVRYNVFRQFLVTRHQMRLPVLDLTDEICDDFATYVKQKYNANYANKVFTLFRGMCAHAVKKKYLDKDPSAFIKVKRGKKKRGKSISVKYLQGIMNTWFAYDPVQRVADLFILECHTGVSYVDLKQLKKDALFKHKGTWWFYIPRTKTGHEAIIPVLPKTLEIMEKYSWNPPIVSLSKYNKYLKVIATLVHIPVALSTKMARTTFGQVMIDSGCSLESVAKMLGHNTTTTTVESYVRIGVERIAYDKKAIKRFGTIEPLSLPKVA